MKKVFVIAALVSLIAGCGRVDSVVNNVKSATGFLDRTVTMYDANGKVIKTWQTSNTIEYLGPVAGFVDNNGVNVRISGSFIIEGK